jgi:hypothetical protein
MADEDIPPPPPAPEPPAPSPPVNPPTPSFNADAEAKALQQYLDEQEKIEDAIRAEEDPALEELRSECDAYRESLKKA